MNCAYSGVRISSLLDRELEEGERRDTLAHLESCGACRDAYQSLEKQRLAMRSMDESAVPQVLTHRLRVLASHERVRQSVRASVSARLRHMAGRARLYMDNMMRPVALPVGGGAAEIADGFSGAGAIHVGRGEARIASDGRVVIGQRQVVAVLARDQHARRHLGGPSCHRTCNWSLSARNCRCKSRRHRRWFRLNCQGAGNCHWPGPDW